ncbi:TIGR02453 family protein [Flavobacteriaceae bacterium JJC]|nr:TIGR02453 family protein [Flavobacteriaceae bacterium JJC]
MSVKIESTTLNFLRNLTKNNNREWFAENKEKYISAQENVISFVENLIENIGEFDGEILKTDAKKSVFRIYRDVRFSQDKSPYKTNFGAGLGMGKGNKISGYYLHIEPGKSFLAGGVYQPEPSVLKEIRKEISMNGKDFLKILEQKEFRHNFRGLSVEGKLKRVPTGFDKEDPMAEYLKLKNFIVIHPISDEALMNSDASKNFAKIYQSIKPLNDFLSAPFI